MSDQDVVDRDNPEDGAPGIDVDQRRVAAVAQAIADGDGRLVADELVDLHPADAADVLEQLSLDQFRSALELAPRAFDAEVLAELTDDSREIALESLPTRHIARAVGDLDSDDAAHLLEELADERREEVLAELPQDERSAVEESLSFEEDTAGRLMQREFVAAPEFWTVGDAIDHMRDAGEDDLPESFHEIYVVDPAFRPIGAVPLGMLLRKRRGVPLSEIMSELHTSIGPDMDQEDVAYVFSKYHLIQAPVVDEAGRLKGILTVDDVVDVIQEENAEDMLALAGVSEAGVGQTAWEQVRARAPWLAVNLVTAIGASIVIALFENTIQQVVALAVLMPIVAGMGGNAGTQALAVAVTALASRDITPANARRMVVREAMAGWINGFIFAAMMAVRAMIWFGDPMIAVVIAVANVVNFVCAGLGGILVPLTLKRIGADPAVASAVFVTTISDVVGFFVFLGLATLVLL